MAETARRPFGRRQPLIELPNSANTPPAQRRNSRHGKAPSSSSPGNLPHNESLEPNGSLAVRGSSQPNSPEHKRVAQVLTEEEYNAKRASAISTTSTNASGRKRKAYIGHWQLGKTIGKGGCSRVRAVRHRYTQQYGAVKIIARSTAESTRAQSLANLIESTRGTSNLSPGGFKPIPYGLEREIALMKLLEHENIVRLYDVWENRNELYLIMEYVDGGELFHHVEQRRGLPEDETVVIFRQIVAALLYCHRLHICHRDLKPENILLNQENLQVKLIDFGMAALQPEGRLLTTPCGSPHYAAPEVVSARPYNGKQADAWSCGVILYVMLTGTTPYNYSQEGDIRALFRDISRAKYAMPPGLSLEAKDLIRKIFVPDPKHRITLDAIWDHPLLHKYDKMLGFDGPEGSKEAAIGPVPKLEDWTIKSVHDVDRDILRNMRTLWHSEPENSLMQKLLNKDVNQEKIFYAALLKHREENLENYVGDVDGMTYSASDYHHSQVVAAQDIPPVPLDQQKRSQSQYSIMNDEHLRPSHSFVEPPPSVSSYDPYRASKDPLVNRGDYVNVVVHRNMGGGGSGKKSSTKGSTRQQPKSLRVDTLKHGSRRISRMSNSNLNLARLTRSKSSLRSSSLSRHSLSSSIWPSSPPVIASMKPSDLHKRGVSFNHVRRTSTTGALTSQPSSSAMSTTPRLKDLSHAGEAFRAPSNTLQVPESSPTLHYGQAIRSRKEKAHLLETPRAKGRSGEVPAPGPVDRNEIRKHSVELEKACEEAFFRSSVGSNLTASYSPLTDDKASTNETPPSSVSAYPSLTPEIGGRKTGSRPLPDLPRDTPTSYLTRTLAETREKLAAYKSQGDASSAKFDEVLDLLDNIMPSAQKAEKRLTSAPETRASERIHGFLPVLSEEQDQRGVRPNRYRSATAPITAEKRREGDKSIRLVPQSPPAHIAPLNIRKRGDDSSSGEDLPCRVPAQQTRGSMRRQRSHDATTVLDPIDEDEVLPAAAPTLRKKRSAWFGLGRKTTNEQESDETGISSEASAAERNDQGRSIRVLSKSAGSPSAANGDVPTRKKRFGSGKTAFAKWLGRLGADGRNDEEGESYVNMAAGGERSLDSLFSTQSPSPSSSGPPASTSGPERSWFARFLNIKPATKLLCFSIPRGRTRQELVLLLKEWQRHGIRDLQWSREDNTLTARVDKRNSLDIKPVSFRVELFVVLEHGRKVGLSIARFSQVKGAASGFRRVLDVIDGVMRGRGWLVEDEEKWKALCDVIGG